jgi:hypothetical protein
MNRFCFNSFIDRSLFKLFAVSVPIRSTCANRSYQPRKTAIAAEQSCGLA